MPHPNFLKVMGAMPHQYNALNATQKDDFNKEAQKRLLDLQENDMEAYIELTNAPVEEVASDNPNAERRFF